MSTNLTKREIVLQIYEKTGFPQKEVQTTVQMTLDIIMNALAAGRNVELRNFGVLEVQVRKARVASRFPGIGIVTVEGVACRNVRTLAKL